ncbi:MAG: hypothetical protein VB125_02770 [Burkholderia sp.]
MKPPGTCSSAVRPYCLRSKTWGSLRPYVHLCNNADVNGNLQVATTVARWLRASCIG